MGFYLQVFFCTGINEIGAIWRLPNFVKSYYNDLRNVMQAGEQFMVIFIVPHYNVSGREFLVNLEKILCGL